MIELERLEKPIHVLRFTYSEDGKFIYSKDLIYTYMGKREKNDWKAIFTEDKHHKLICRKKILFDTIKNGERLLVYCKGNYIKYSLFSSKILNQEEKNEKFYDVIINELKKNPKNLDIIKTIRDIKEV